MKKIILMCVLWCSPVYCCAALLDGLITYHSFSGNANDESGNDYHGIVSGAILTTDRFGIHNNAYSFDGIDDYIEVPNTNSVFDLVQAWSISLWVKPTVPISPPADESSPLIWKTAQVGTNDETFTMGWEGTKLLVRIERASNGEDVKLFSSATYDTVTDWFHIVATYDGNWLKMYINGVPENSSEVGLVIPHTGPAALRIGNNQHRNSSRDSAFYGVIDDVYIYNRGLAPMEIIELYNIPEPATLLCSVSVR